MELPLDCNGATFIITWGNINNNTTLLEEAKAPKWQPAITYILFQ